MVCSHKGIQKSVKSKLNFSVHFELNCYYYPDLACDKFNSVSGVAVCQKPDSERCCWLPSSIPVGFHQIVWKEGVLYVE
jgi:hypothetical protein